MSFLIGICCGFILNVIHILFSFYLQLKLFKYVFLKCVSNVQIFFCNKSKRHRFECEFIERNVRHLPKLPKHLTFAIGEECISYSDLVQIILWTLPAGIPVLSFYDHRDELDPNILYRTFSENHPKLRSSIRWGVSFSKKCSSEDAYSSKVSPHHLQVNLLNSKHGRQLLIDSIKELCSKNDLKIGDRAATEAALDSIMLSKLSYSGDPDFLIISGHVYKTFGLSPWHIGFTEFLTIPSYRLLTVNDYISVLRCYAKCDQKFGR